MKDLSEFLFSFFLFLFILHLCEHHNMALNIIKWSITQSHMFPLFFSNCVCVCVCGDKCDIICWIILVATSCLSNALRQYWMCRSIIFFVSSPSTDTHSFFPSLAVNSLWWHYLESFAEGEGRHSIIEMIHYSLFVTVDKEFRFFSQQ